MKAWLLPLLGDVSSPDVLDERAELRCNRAAIREEKREAGKRRQRILQNAATALLDDTAFKVVLDSLHLDRSRARTT